MSLRSEFGLYTATTVDEWTAILDLAAKWNFRSIKTLAIKQLTPIASPIDKIVWGRKHQINEWLGGAYQSICAREEPLTYEEGIRLGMKDVIKISAIRHDIGSRTRSGPLPLLSNEELQMNFGLDIGLLPLSLDERNSEASSLRAPPDPGDDDSCAPQILSSQPACISNNVNAAQYEPLKQPSLANALTKTPLTKAQQKKKKQQEAKEAKEKADREFQEQLERELAEEASEFLTREQEFLCYDSNTTGS
jgi:hypothetical protein